MSAYLLGYFSLDGYPACVTQVGIFSEPSDSITIVGNYHVFQIGDFGQNWGMEYADVRKEIVEDIAYAVFKKRVLKWVYPYLMSDDRADVDEAVKGLEMDEALK